MPRKAEKVKEEVLDVEIIPPAEVVSPSEVPLELTSIPDRVQYFADAISKGKRIDIQTQVFAELVDDLDEEENDDRELKNGNFTPEERKVRQKAFLTTLQATARIDCACAAAGINYNTYRKWMKSSRQKRFQKAVTEIRTTANRDLLEARLSLLGFSDEKVANGAAFQATIARLNAEWPEKYKQKTVEVNHNIRDYGGLRRLRK